MSFRKMITLPRHARQLFIVCSTRKECLLFCAAKMRCLFLEKLCVLFKGVEHYFLMKTLHTSWEPPMQCYTILSDDGPSTCMEHKTVLDHVPLVEYKLVYHKYPVLVLKHAILDMVWFGFRNLQWTFKGSFRACWLDFKQVTAANCYSMIAMHNTLQTLCCWCTCILYAEHMLVLLQGTCSHQFRQGHKGEDKTKTAFPLTKGRISDNCVKRLWYLNVLLEFPEEQWRVLKQQCFFPIVFQLGYSAITWT